MLKYKDVVVAENRHKVFVCEMKNSGNFMSLTVAEGCEQGWALYNNDNSRDFREYFEEDIEVILQEYETPELDDYEDQQEYWDNDEIDLESLKPFSTSVSSVYKYNSMEDLDTIIKSLDEPIIDGLGCSWEEDYKEGLTKSFGLVFYWSEYDDFSCGNPYTPYCKIIDGGKIDE